MGSTRRAPTRRAPTEPTEPSEATPKLTPIICTDTTAEMQEGEGAERRGQEEDESLVQLLNDDSTGDNTGAVVHGNSVAPSPTGVYDYWCM